METEVVHLEIDMDAERLPDERRKITLSGTNGPIEVDAAIYGEFALHLRARSPYCTCPFCMDPQLAAVTLTHVKTGLALGSFALRSGDPDRTICFMEAMIAALEGAGLDWDYMDIKDIPERTRVIAPKLLEIFMGAYDALGKAKAED